MGRSVPMAREPLEKELEQANRDDLIVACQVWGVDMSSVSSGTSLITLLAEKMKDKAERDRVFDSLPQNEKDLLGMLALNGGAMSDERLRPYRKIYSYGQLNQTERDLRRKGIVIRQMMSRQTEFGREVAEFKVVDFFLPFLIQYFSRKPKSRPELMERAKTFVNERDSLIVDLALFLAHITKNDVRMTSSWEFPRREIDHMMSVMSKPTEERFDTVQRIARKAGLYTVESGDRPIPTRVGEYLSGNHVAVARRLLMVFLGRTRAIWATPDQPTEYTLTLAICRLRESSTDEWISIDEMVEWIRSELFMENEPLKWIQVNAERVAVALEPAINLGIVEAAYRGTHLLAVKLTQVGACVITGTKAERIPSGDVLVVQPNFEVSCYTSDMDYAKLYRLMLFTDPVKTDIVSTFRITERSVFQGTSTGMSVDQMIDYLQRESSKQVPANVIRSMKDWASRIIGVTLENVVLLETESEAQLESLLFRHELKEFLVRRVGPCAAVVKGDTEELARLLRENRCRVRLPNEKAAHETVEPPPTFDLGMQLGEIEISDVPSACEACPAIQSCNRVIRRKRLEARAKGS
ncbi:MAG: helicase-associated domain-containing protein [Candidatus Thorarchaeota archaeon]